MFAALCALGATTDAAFGHPTTRPVNPSAARGFEEALSPKDGIQFNKESIEEFHSGSATRPSVASGQFVNNLDAPDRDRAIYINVCPHFPNEHIEQNIQIKKPIRKQSFTVKVLSKAKSAIGNCFVRSKPGPKGQQDIPICVPISKLRAGAGSVDNVPQINIPVAGEMTEDQEKDDKTDPPRYSCRDTDIFSESLDDGSHNSEQYELRNGNISNDEESDDEEFLKSVRTMLGQRGKQTSTSPTSPTYLNDPELNDHHRRAQKARVYVVDSKDAGIESVGVLFDQTETGHTPYASSEILADISVEAAQDAPKTYDTAESGKDADSVVMEAAFVLENNEVETEAAKESEKNQVKEVSDVSDIAAAQEKPVEHNEEIQVESSKETRRNFVAGKEASALFEAYASIFEPLNEDIHKELRHSPILHPKYLDKKPDVARKTSQKREASRRLRLLLEFLRRKRIIAR